MRKVAFIVILCGLLLSSLSLVCSACSPYYTADPQYLVGRTVRGVVPSPQFPSGGYAYRSSTDPNNPIPIALNTNRVFYIYFTDATGQVMDEQIYDYDSRAGNTTNDKLETMWDFGDGTTPVVSTGNSPSPSTSHKFTTAGPKTITWYVRDLALIGGQPTGANDNPALDKPGDVPVGWDTGGKLYVFVENPPDVPIVTDDGDYTSSTTTLHASWFSPIVPDCQVVYYAYYVKNSGGGYVKGGYTANNGITLTGLNLKDGETYYFYVRAYHRSGAYSPYGVSNGITVTTWTASPNVILVSTKGDDTYDKSNINKRHWGNAMKSIKAAIAMASEGDEIWVAKGLYEEWDIHLKSGVPVYGGYVGIGGRDLRDPAKYHSIIDVPGSIKTIVNVRENDFDDNVCTSEKKIDGFTFQRASCGVNVSDPRGDVVLPVVISNNIFRENTTAVVCSYVASVKIVGNRMENNLTAISLYSTAADIIGNTIIGDRALGRQQTGISSMSGLSGAYLDIRNNIIEHCASGGINLQDNSGRISNNVIRDNTNNLDPGCGIHLELYSGGAFEISNNTITGNHSNIGATIYVFSGDELNQVTVANNIIAFNDSSIVFDRMSPEASLLLLNNCFWQNGTGTIPEGAIGSVTANPLLAPDGVHIQSNSPCVNAGSNQIMPVNTDIDEQGRYNGIIDIGADESYGTRWYDLTLYPEKTSVMRGSTAEIYANVKNGGTPVGGCRIYFTASGGSITEPDPIITDQYGNACAPARRDSVGKMTVTASIPAPGSTIGEWIEKSVNIWVYDPATEVWPTLHGNVERQNAAGSLPVNDSWQARLMMTIPSDDGGYTIQRSSPVIAYGNAYLAANDEEGTLYSIGLDGAGPRSTKLLRRIDGTPSAKYGSIFVGTDNGLACTLDAASLDLQWAAIGGWSPLSSSAVSGNELVFTSYGPEESWSVLDLDMETNKDWSPKCCSFANFLAPTINSDRLYIFNGDNVDGQAYSIETGQSFWEAQAEMSSSTTPVAYTYNDKKYIFCCGNNLTRIIDNGSSCFWDWSKDVFWVGGTVVATPAVYNGKVYVANVNGDVYCINAVATPMTEIWPPVNLGAPISSAPVICGNSLVVATEDGKVYVLNATTGVVLRQFTIDGKITASPAVANGKIYVVSDTAGFRSLYCIGQ